MKINIITWIALTAILLSALLYGCLQSTDAYFHDKVNITSYKDIPGVTEQEIDAIEALREQTGDLIFGMMLSTEAFEDKNGEVNGFAVLF